MIRVGFALLSPSVKPIPSTRIACLNIFPYLRQMGFDPIVVFEPKGACESPDVSGLVENVLERNIDIVVFQKICGSSVLGAALRFRDVGIRTVYCVCDLVNDEMVRATDATIAVTNFLKSLHAPELQSRIHVVHDGIERPECQRALEGMPGRRTLSATLVTSHTLFRVPVINRVPNGWTINIVGAFGADFIARLREFRWALHHERDRIERWKILESMADPRIKRIRWEIETVYTRLCASDIGIIPIDTRSNDLRSVPSWKVKSENRLTLNMSMGLPVIATPIPAYEDIIEHGVNGFFARSDGDWQRCFQELRDPELRAEIGRNARSSVLERFSKALQAERFASVLRTL